LLRIVRECSEHATVSGMENLRWQIGDAVVSRVAELDASSALDGLIREFDLKAMRQAGWLTPHFVDGTGGLRGVVQAFVITIGGKTIVVDPGVGNSKHRTAVPGWGNLQTDFLHRLRASGVDPTEVDYVVDTHLHFDHVGWHTDLVSDAWQPTFPSARYVMSAAEFQYWQMKPTNEIPDQHAGFADSVLPVYQAGLVDLVADDHIVTDGVRLVPSPGHTPHHLSVVIESGGRSAVITGDVMHHPCQIAYPTWGAVSDFDPDQARRSRSDLLERFADTDTLIIGTHFADPVAGWIHREGTAFRLRAAVG
jgi:glyoxylase-like metal-dependent hydrolase (beta-lactamase superfamily II)